MKNFIQRFIKTCPKTGRFRGIKPLKGFTHLLLPFIGFIALLWILIRVVKKPSRIDYPCIKAAMPFAAGFIQNIIVFVISAVAFAKVKNRVLKNQFLVAALLVTFSIGGNYFTDNNLYQSNLVSNEPMGEAKGIFPGRVVWVHNPEATNKNCSPNTIGNGWFLNENNDQSAIDNMLSSGLKNLTGTSSDSTAWDSIFIFYNRNKGKGEVGYQEEEKIFIKINATSGWSGNYNPSDLSKMNNNYYGVSETSPQLVLSVLRHLVNLVGVPEDKIYIGDPMKHIYKHCYDLWNAEFPDVHYLDHDNFYSNLGREQAEVSSTAKIYYSDRGTVLRTNVWSGNDQGDDPVTEDYLYKILDEAEYIINIPTLKGHKRAGITAFAKNHFGSHTREDAAHLHNGLVAPTELPNVTRPGYGLYRIQVDLMSHYILGEKNLLYLMDALWSADQEISFPKKFYMQPFNNDWMSSIFLSLDPVAIESVGYDFLRTEFTSERPGGDGAGLYVQMNGTDDYLHQAADSSNWPDTLIYDPENDGTPIAFSLGTHEHWNNSTDMKYSRNLGTGDGIELLKASPLSAENINNDVPSGFVLYQNYPNPFNPSTTITFKLKEGTNTNISVYDISGKLVDIILDNEYKPAGTYQVKYNGEKLSSGVYFVQMQSGSYVSAIKMILMK